jgi:nucleoid-associated protein
MPNDIRHLAVHDVRRTQNGLHVVHGNDNLAVNTTTQRIVDELDDMYGKRSSKAHGKFSDDRDNYPASGYFEAYLAPLGGGDFANLTQLLMNTLVAKARSVPNAGAGHVFFAQFERDGRELMLIAIVTEKLGAALTRHFNAQDVTHLDLEGFRFAGRIDLTGWQGGDERYVGFLRGRGEVAEYFKEFLGCVSSVSDKTSTQELVTALREYVDVQEIDAALRDDFMVRAKGILDRSARSNEQLDFQTFANELVPASPQALTDHLGQPARKLGDGFVANSRVLNTLVKFRARTPRWSIEIDRGALRDGEIVFDAARNTLTITNLSAELAADLRAEFADDAAD